MEPFLAALAGLPVEILPLVIVGYLFYQYMILNEKRENEKDDDNKPSGGSHSAKG